MGRRRNALLEPAFKRGEVAKILNVHPRTVTRREREHKYPPARRDLNTYRVYTLNEVLNLQLLTYGRIDLRPIAELLFEKGWDDPKRVTQLLDNAMARRTGG